MKIMNLPPLYFKYSTQRTRDPDTGERGVIHIPKVPCRMYNGSRSIADNAILDSGADSCVINMTTAQYLGLDLEPARPMRVVGNSQVEAFRSTMEIVLGGGKRTDPIPVEVMIPAKGDTPILIGRKPIFEMYIITFIEPELKFNMTPYEKK